MALPTNGRVLIETTVGDIDIELWSKETPKTCRNFIALALEGYYDGVIFHRVVPGFLVQTGDKTGTGQGGESFYGDVFEDEIHPRLRFAHRGLVAMANGGKKNTNDSQFIITLDRADELHGKHTLFGRCIGDSIYNVLKIGEKEIDKDGRPLYPPKIKTVRVIDNPFEDIVPRITAAEKRAQQKAKEEAQKEREEAERRKGAKKDVKLLSFGADEDAGEDEEPVVFKKKAIFRPDLVENPEAKALVMPDFSSMSKPAASSKGKDKAKAETSTDPQKDSKAKEKGKEVDISKIREQHAKEKASSSASRLTEIEKMEAELRSLTKRRSGHDSSSDSEGGSKRKKKHKKSYLEEELAKYTSLKDGNSGRGKRDKEGKKVRGDEKDILEKMMSFRGRLKESMELEDDGLDAEEGEHPLSRDDEGAPPPPGAGGEEEGMEIDDDVGFLGHRLQFPKDGGEESRKAERDYEVIDPRQRGARAKEEERERKRTAAGAKGRGGGGGRYRR